MTQKSQAGHADTATLPDIEVWLDPNEDRLREECGVFGIAGNDEAAVITALGLHALQHRGQEGCGIVTFDGNLFANERHMGLVGDHFTGPDLMKRLPGQSAIGHVRYATQGGTILRNIQPLFADLSGGGIGVAHNGNITNARMLREQLVENGAIFQSTSDSEVILQLIARSRAPRTIDRFVDALHQIEGAYALVALTNKSMIGARDPLGIRPLVLGELNGAPVLASETCALDMIGATFVREIENGEVVVCRPDGKVESIKPFGKRESRPCVFEYVYFSRPDSVVGGKSVYDVRKRMGRRLAQETGIEADVIVPVPDSGVPAALGYSEASGIPYELGIIRNHYVGRTFIEPTQQMRTLGVRRKHSANRGVLAGKRVILVDDSIVRGTTSRKIVQMVRDAGAIEVHLRSASPAIQWPDFYGIDMPDRDQLIAGRKSVEEMADMLGVDSLGFLSVDGLYWALGEAARNAQLPRYSDHCFTGDYPTRLVDNDRSQSDKGHQLSFLVDA
jgi:amidophosphoribosyltransferase